jgi:hypothetical protein
MIHVTVLSGCGLTITTISFEFLEHAQIICIYMVCLNMEIKRRKYDANYTYDIAVLRIYIMLSILKQYLQKRHTILKVNDSQKS